MAGIFKKIVELSIFAAVFPALALGAQSSVGRSVNGRNAGETADSVSSASIRRAATSVIARNVTRQNERKGRTFADVRPVVSRVVSNREVIARGVGGTDSAAATRSAIRHLANVARSASKSNLGVRSASMVKAGANVSRSAKARATAVFNDVSKIGGGYAACRDSYATCMDQFCANANDTYRRCYCSDRFVSFRKTADSLDQALEMLADFQNTNLDAVNKTAAEVNAMYTASEGEAAIKRDTSASQKMLNSIAEILSGKSTYKKNTSSSGSSSSSPGVLDLSGLFSFSGSDGDVFSGGSSFDVGGVESLFGGGSSSRYTNMSDMEGAELYEAANRQCSAITNDDCTSDAVFNLARSAYSILVTQDCNLYEKNINAKKESVQNTVRTAEKYLREARLEEYRAHNSADVNACLNQVEAAMLKPTACGENYSKCLDYSGLYINLTTGEPVYSKALFDLNNLIVLDGTSDVLGANPKFNTFLDERKMFATSALDTCRGIADTVWYEFKRSALIQIAQAQDAKIQQVKDSCVSTISKCYDKQTDDLNELGGDEISIKTGAISAIAAHDMCRDQVLACAALYGDPNGCVYDDKTKKILQNPDKGAGTCGLRSLLAYVNTVDSVRVAQGCETSLRAYAKELCGDDEEDYPWGCRKISVESLRQSLKKYASLVCGEDLIEEEEEPRVMVKAPVEVVSTKSEQNVATVASDKAAKHNTKLVAVARAAKVKKVATTNEIDTSLVAGLVKSSNVIDNIIKEIESDLSERLSQECFSIVGEGRLFWSSTNVGIDSEDVISLSPTYMQKIYDSDLGELKKTGFNYPAKIEKTGLSIKGSGSNSFGWGVCMQPTEKQLCNMQLDLPNIKGSAYVEYGASGHPANECYLHTLWYKARCTEIGGYWDNDSGTCFIR